jgi:Tol biopolymer transport system component
VQNRFVWLLIFLVAGQLLAQAGEIAESTPEPPQTSPMAAFVGADQQFLDIFTLDVDTGDIQNITNTLNPDSGVAWHPTEPLIAISAQENGDFNIILIDLVTQEQTVLVDWAESNEISPQWSPDGESILFVSDARDNQDIYQVEIASAETEIIIADGGTDRQPAWLPDESGFVFASRRDGNFVLYTYRFEDETEEILIADDDGRDILQPALSPDGDWLAYVRFSDVAEIILHERATDNIVRISQPSQNSYSPQWLPDQSCVSFTVGLNTSQQAVWIFNLEDDSLQELLINRNQPSGMVWNATVQCDDVIANLVRGER